MVNRACNIFTNKADYGVHSSILATLLGNSSGWINSQQQEIIEYLRTENRVHKEKYGGKCILLNDDQRRRLAVKGKILGRKRLEEFGTLFTPDCFAMAPDVDSQEMGLQRSP